MNRLGLANITHERVLVQVSDSVSGVLVSVSGDIDMQDPSKLLDPFFLELHKEALKLSIAVVEVDVRRLNFLNSSGIKALAKWIMMISPVPAGKRYQVRLLHDRSLAWQAASLPTLTFLVPGAVILV